jgi:hypothetical protein
MAAYFKGFLGVHGSLNALLPEKITMTEAQTLL